MGQSKSKQMEMQDQEYDKIKQSAVKAMDQARQKHSKYN